MYRGEAVMRALVGVFAAIAIVIACLGLFGLAAFTAEQRTKEIGVRKVLGASVARLVALLSRDFLALVLVGFLAACPLAYPAVSEWLDGFAYRTELGPSVFLGAGAAVVVLAFETVSFQTVKVALADPVRSLRFE